MQNVRISVTVLIYDPERIDCCRCGKETICGSTVFGIYSNLDAIKTYGVPTKGQKRYLLLTSSDLL